MSVSFALKEKVSYKPSKPTHLTRKHKQLELILLENKQFHFHAKSTEEISLLKSFKSSRSSGLLRLLSKDLAQTASSESLVFWRSFSSLCLREFCLFCDEANEFQSNELEIKKFLEKAPYIRGQEFLDFETLKLLQIEIISVLKKEALKWESSREFLKNSYPDWYHMGRVYFHLAENPKEDSNDFVFLATYTNKLSHKKRLQHVTFGKALEDSIDQKRKDLALKILKPLKNASNESLFVKDLLESKKIYGPILLSPKETQKFLEEFSNFEKHGIRVKLPKAWEGKKPQKAKVCITLEENEPTSFLNFHSLFQFRPVLTLKGTKIGHEELSKILETDDGLIKIRGNWVDINREKLNTILSYWEKARVLNAKGLSFTDALKILGKCSVTLGSSEASIEEEFLETKSSEQLQKLIENLKKPILLDEEKLTNILDKNLKAKARPYQKEGILWLHFLRERELGACLCDDMGLGKTLQMIGALLLNKGLYKKNNPSLLVSPSSLLGNWASELQKFAPSLKYKILHPSFDISRKDIDKLENHYQDYDLLITSYHRLDRTNWLFDKEWNFFILDEAQMIKNPETSISKATKRIISSCKIALTGTPIENKVLDLWSLYDFCLPGLLGSLNEFKSFYRTMMEKESFKPLKDLIQPYLLRRLKTDKKIISDLPDKIEKKVYCFLSDSQVKLYKETLDKLSKDLKTTENESKRKGLILGYLLKFKQICNHPSQFLSDGDYEELKSGKFQELKRIAETISQRKEKLLVFTQFREITDILDNFLQKIFQAKGFVIHGGVTPQKRKELVEKFQSNEENPYFILSLKAGGSGLNLTRANHVVHFDRWWNPAVEMQASDRSFRIGQKKNVMIHKFITKGTLEEKIDQMINKKKDLIFDMIESSNLEISKLSNQDVISMMSLESKEQKIQMTYYEDIDEKPLSMKERRFLTEKKRAELESEGYDLNPIELKPREKIAKTFWSKLWCKNLTLYEDLDYRLAEGRSLLSTNAILDFNLDGLKLEALVYEDQVHTIVITFKAYEPEKWKLLKQKLLGKVSSVYSLLSGDLSDEICALISERDEGLFPDLNEIHFSCPCTDYASLCKHSSACLIGFSKLFDKDPGLFFKLRGLDPLELIEKIDTDTNNNSKILSNEAASKVFDIDLEGI